MATELHFCHGDMFERIGHVDVLVNAVNCVGIMGGGIAKAFKDRWPRMYNQYRRDCMHGKLMVGRVHVWALPYGSNAGFQYIFNFPTKDDLRSPSQLDWIRSGLVSLREEAASCGVISVALPALGCGIGGLLWEDVRPIMIEILSSQGDDDEVEDYYIYEPQS